MISYYHRTLRDQGLRTLDTPKAGSWIHIEAPSEEELAELVSTYHLDASLLRDGLDPDEMPRLETEDEVVYIFLRFAYANGQQIATAPILVAVSPSFTFTLSANRLPTLSNFVDGRIKFTTTQKAKFVLQLLTQISGTYSGFLALTSRQIRSARARLNIEHIGNDDVISFVNLEDVLNDFLTELIPTGTLLANLLTGRKNLVFYEEDKDLIEDLLLNNQQVIETAKSNLKTIMNIREAYSTIMTNNLNRKVGMLTALTIILTVPTFFASLFGMNVKLPLPEQDGISFWLIAAGIAVVTVSLLAMLRRSRWL